MIFLPGALMIGVSPRPANPDEHHGDTENTEEGVKGRKAAQEFFLTP